MINFSFKSISSPGSWIILAIVLCAFIMLNVNIVLWLGRDNVLELVNQDLTHQVSVGHVWYLFPDTILIKDISLRARASSPDGPLELVRISRVIAKISLARSLSSKTVNFSRFFLFGARAQYAPLMDFLSMNWERLQEKIRLLPQGDIHLVFKKVVIDKGEKNSSAQRWRADCQVDVTGEKFDVLGFFQPVQLDYSEGILELKPVRYHLQGCWKGREIWVEKLAAQGELFYAQLWGRIDFPAVYLKGFNFFHAARAVVPLTKAKYFLTQIKAYFNRYYVAGLDEPPPAIELYMLDINARARIQLPKVIFEQMDFTLNNTPMMGRGEIEFSLTPRWDFDFDFVPTVFNDQDKGDFQIAGIQRGNRWEMNLDVASTFSVDPEEGGIEAVKLRLHDFVILSEKKSYLRLSAGDAEYEFKIRGNPHIISVKDLKAVLMIKSDHFQAKVAAPFYGGEISGDVRIARDKMPSKIDSIMHLRNVDAPQLDKLLVHFAKIAGRLYGTIGLEFDQHLKLYGQLKIRKGVLDKYDFFNWLADTFLIPSVRTINFDKTEAHFTLSARQVGLDAIDLDSQGVKIKGHYLVDQDGLVNSKLSLIFSQELLSESPKMRGIVKRLDDIDPLVFDFQLSGQQQALNYQWLPSPLKSRVQELIPDFIERKIERNVTRD